MKLVMRVKLMIAEDPRRVLPNIKAALYDRDWKTEDDFLGTGVSDAKGEIFFTFEDSAYQDAEDGPSWRAESLPDLYVNLYDANDKVVYSTREVTERDKFPKLLIVPVPQAVAKLNGLIKE